MKNYQDKLIQMENHIAENPHDYQSIISYLKMNSEAIEQSRRLRQIEKLRKISLYRERSDEQSE